MIFGGALTQEFDGNLSAGPQQALRGRDQLTQSRSAGSLPQVGHGLGLPIFKLSAKPPRGAGGARIVNRMPREETAAEREAHVREREETMALRRQLGLSDAELEEVLAGGASEALSAKSSSAGGEPASTVSGFMSHQLALPRLPVAQQRGGVSFEKRRRPAGWDEADVERARRQRAAIARRTPRCLQPRANATLGELRHELNEAMANMDALGRAVREDVTQIHKLGITVAATRNPAAAVFMRQWAVDKFARIFTQLMFTRQAGAWRKWRGVIEAMSKRERIASHLRYQGLRRMALFLHGWLMKQVQNSWNKWMDHVRVEQQKESEAIELRAAIAMQRAYRGHAARGLVNEMRRVRNERDANAAALRLQSLWRARQTRVNFKQLLRNKHEADAAMQLQCAARGKLARMKVRAHREERRREQASLLIQSVTRGRVGRKKFAARATEVRELEAAKTIQRYARGRQGRHRGVAQRKYRREYGAASSVQRRIRGWQARERVAILDEARQKQRAKEDAAAMKLQSVYRGHQGRQTHQERLHMHLARQKLERESATTISRMMRGHLARKHVNQMKALREQKMLTDARSYIETWSDDAYKWFYYNAETKQALWEPPPNGYTKKDGKLVLVTGKVIDDPLNRETEEEAEAAAKAAEAEGKLGELTEAAEAPLRELKEFLQDRELWATGSGAAGAALSSRDLREVQDDHFDTMCHMIAELAHELHQAGRLGPPGARPGENTLAEGGGVLAAAGAAIGADAAANANGGSAAPFAADDGGMAMASAATSGDEWAQYEDEEGNPFWCVIYMPHPRGFVCARFTTTQLCVCTRNPRDTFVHVLPTTRYHTTTGESTYANPYGGGGTEGTESIGQAGSSSGEWQQAEDEQGVVYYYNTTTGESTYDNPYATAADGGAQEEWQQVEDENGDIYYYSTITGVSQYEDPHAV